MFSPFGIIKEETIMAGRYDRAFITLKQERGDYSINGKAAMGSSIIESKGHNGKVSMIVQNLKPRVLYRCYLIRVNNGKALGISLGTVPVDARGSGQVRKEVDARDVEGSGFPLEDFNVVALIVPRDKELIVPLAGYRKDDVKWKDSFTEYKPGTPRQRPAETPVMTDKAVEIPEAPMDTENIEEEPETPITNENAQEEPETPVTDENIQEEPEMPVTAETIEEAPETSDMAKDVQEEQDISASNENQWKHILIHDDAYIPDNTAELNKDNDSQDESQDLAKNDADGFTAEASEGKEPDIHEEFRAMIQRFNKELEELKYYTFLTEEEQEAYKAVTAEVNKKTTPDSLKDIFEIYESLSPFDHQSRPVKWVRITTKELKYLPVDYHLLMSSPFVASAYRQYQHLILGYVDDNWGRQYILGIPERYDPEYKTKTLRMGFNQFKCCENVRPQVGECGYWLMGIDV